MQIQITGRHMDITEGLRSIVEKKADKLRHYLNRIIDIQVILAVDKLEHIAECTVVSDIKSFFCEARSGDMYESVDRLFAKMERQIRRYLEKQQGKRLSEGQIHESLDSNLFNTHAALPKISRIEEVSPKPMTPHEAILQLETAGTAFKMFIHSEDPAFREALIYRNGSGYVAILPNDYGWRQHYVTLDPLRNLNWGEKTDYYIPTLTLDEAFDKMRAYTLDRQIFYDPENDSLNVLYPNKDGNFSLLTSGEGLYRSRSDLGVM